MLDLFTVAILFIKTLEKIQKIIASMAEKAEYLYAMKHS
jgi:hypothetical protein